MPETRGKVIWSDTHHFIREKVLTQLIQFDQKRQLERHLLEDIIDFSTENQ